MSQSEIERFVADMKSNDALRGEAERLQPDTSQGMPLAPLVSFAASKGYGVTADDFTAFARAKARAEGKSLTDAELDSVAGGAASYQYTYFMGVDNKGHQSGGDGRTSSKQDKP